MSTYPLRGILYFLGDRHLWRLTLCPVLLTVAVAFGVAITLFTLTLHRQERALYDAGLSSFFAWLIAVIFVIVEVFIVTVVYGLVCLEWFKDKIFAHVLIERGYRELVENEERHSPFLRVLTSCCRVSVMLRLGLLVVTLPLNMIPVLGNVTYAWLNGTLMAWEAHLYYFEMKAFDFEQQKEVIAARKLQYSSFGMQAMLLEMIPIAGAIFMFTNAAGAALFAASIEKELEKQEQRKNSKWSWSSKNKESKSKKSHEKAIDMDKVPLVNKLGAYVPPYGSTSK
ncbi:Homogentisate 1 [Phytophthora cinnamomi]|uniref:Homogentisate 1 n=1 Tax=Phytophthora cinnamomi TaxID=4785 RepID=UPI00355946C2|nr:Homogentisate 1 [Phytophthora cinnamomi]